MTTVNHFQGPFLFVNKDSSNYNRRSANESYAIGSHVAGPYTKWSKVSRTRTPDTYLPAVPGQVNAPEGTSNEESDEAFRVSTSRSTASATRRFKQSVSRATVGPSVAAPRRPLRPQGRRTHAHPMTLVQCGNSDPFSASSVEITSFNSFLISSWHTIFRQTIFPSEMAEAGHTADISWHNESLDLIESAERMHFMLAWTLMLQFSAMSASPRKKQLEIDALIHKAKGMASLQQKMTTMSKLTAIRAIWHLIGTEFYGGDSVAAVTHFRGLVSMVNSIGGLKSLPWELRKLVVVSDMTLSGSGLTKAPSAFDVDDWDPGSVVPILSPSEATMLAQSTHTERPLHQSIPPGLHVIFLAYRELLAVHRIAADTTDIPQKTNLLLWAQMRQYALSTRVTNIQAHLAGLPASADCFLEKATCVAVDYFLQILWLKNHTQRTVHAPFHHSEGSFEILRRAAEFETSLLNLWTLFVAASVELILKQRGKVGATFAESFTNIRSNLQLRSTAEVRQALSQFLYQDETFNQYLCTLLDPFSTQWNRLGTTKTIKEKILVSTPDSGFS